MDATQHEELQHLESTFQKCIIPIQYSQATSQNLILINTQIQNVHRFLEKFPSNHQAHLLYAKTIEALNYFADYETRLSTGVENVKRKNINEIFETLEIKSKEELESKIVNSVKKAKELHPYNPEPLIQLAAYFNSKNDPNDEKLTITAQNWAESAIKEIFETSFETIDWSLIKYHQIYTQILTVLNLEETYTRTFGGELSQSTPFDTENVLYSVSPALLPRIYEVLAHRNRLSLASTLEVLDLKKYMQQHGDSIKDPIIKSRKQYNTALFLLSQKKEPMTCFDYLVAIRTEHGLELLSELSKGRTDIIVEPTNTFAKEAQENNYFGPEFYKMANIK
jgi:hypothetical protein